MGEEDSVFINLSGEDAKQMGILLRQASQAYNRVQYSQWLHILSSIHERIFHRIIADDETLDSLYGECVKLQKHWNRYKKYEGYGWDATKYMNFNNEKFIDSVRLYSRAVMLELSRQGFFPNRKAMSETRLE